MTLCIIFCTVITMVCGVYSIYQRHKQYDSTNKKTSIKDWIGLEEHEEKTEIVVKVFGPKGTTKKAARRFCRVASDTATITDMKNELDIHENLNLNWIEHANPNKELGNIEIVVARK